MGHSEDAKEQLKPLLVGEMDKDSVPIITHTGKSATTGGEQNMGLVIAIVIVLLAILAYLILN